MVDRLAWVAGELSAIRRQLLADKESPDLVLALDQGGHASRAVLFDAAGREVATAHVPVSTVRPAPDRVEHDADELARSLLVAASDACDTEIARARPIVAAGLATQRSTIVCWDRAHAGRALSAAISWQDRRNAAWLETLRPRAAWVRELTGLVLSPHYGASKLRWCLEHLPAVARAAQAHTLAAGPLSSFLLHRLLDERPFCVDPANASRTQLYDPSTLDWSPALLATFGIPPDVMPRCVATRHEFGTLTIERRRVPLRACTGDQSAAAFGFGRPDVRTAYVNLGTGAFVQRVATATGAAVPDGLLRSVLCSDGDAVVYAQEGTVNGAASAIDWLRQRTALDVDRALHALSSRAVGALEPPLFINGVGGLAAPFWKPDFPIEFVGDGDDSQQLQAVVESIAFLVAMNLEVMQRTGPLERIIVSGGLAGADYLCASLADVCGIRVERYALREATARGVAFLAAGQPDGWPPPPLEREFAPASNESLRARYAHWRHEMERRGATVA